MNASAHIPDDSPLTEFISKRSKQFGGKTSAYVRSLIEADQSNSSENASPTSAEIVADLCRQLRPERALRLVANMEKLNLNQPALIGRLLEELDEDLVQRAREGKDLSNVPVVLLALLPRTMNSLAVHLRFRTFTSAGNLATLAQMLGYSAAFAGDLKVAEEPPDGPPYKQPLRDNDPEMHSVAHLAPKTAPEAELAANLKAKAAASRAPRK